MKLKNNLIKIYGIEIENPTFKDIWENGIMKDSEKFPIVYSKFCSSFNYNL